ncbi:gas vesicle protein GvpG [Planotetraspora sp. A-T 1434]|uniref:gas vesicle protein GvpG n=1 Tax=Planotetraspora sp. A-T 1434 TaxID=2979219 RepID=UPI0021C14CA6|nr:gas vesicle protein GvpG [Planotetraspora sp. A-T 1434]MCT9933969.1 gas vesicle protein GvpG [Planotetraspora sp. A-T 1434]
MGLVGLIVGLPLLPVRGVVRLGELIQGQVERELWDPSVARRQLEDLEQARASGQISEEEYSRAVSQILRRMAVRPGSPRLAASGGSGEGR